jgi:hypothetical protein
MLFGFGDTNLVQHLQALPAVRIMHRVASTTWIAA